MSDDTTALADVVKRILPEWMVVAAGRSACRLGHHNVTCRGRNDGPHGRDVDKPGRVNAAGTPQRLSDEQANRIAEHFGLADWQRRALPTAQREEPRNAYRRSKANSANLAEIFDQSPAAELIDAYRKQRASTEDAFRQDGDL